MLTWPAKDPDEVLDYKLDWSQRLETGETIDTSAWVVDSGDVVISTNVSQVPTINGAITTVWLRSGTDGTVCELTNEIITSGGRTFDQTVKLRIRSH